MQMTFRWFGPNDPIPLAYVRQIPGVRGVVSALYDVPVGDTWPRDGLSRLADMVDGAGLHLEVLRERATHGRDRRARAVLQLHAGVRLDAHGPRAHARRWLDRARVRR